MRENDEMLFAFIAKPRKTEAVQNGSMIYILPRKTPMNPIVQETNRKSRGYIDVNATNGVCLGRRMAS